MNDKYLFYSGHSMHNTFQLNDCIFIEKLKFEKIVSGDVIVFNNIEAKEKVEKLVHRVVKFSTKGLMTQGDNNNNKDNNPVTINNFIGRVNHYERNGKIHKVWNGRLGLMRARVLYGRLHIIRATKFFLRKPYRILKKTGIVSKLWRPEIETICFETQDGPLVKYVHKGQTVASCWLDSNRWWFRRPYDFVIGPKLK